MVTGNSQGICTNKNR